MANTSYELAKLREYDAKLDKREQEVEQTIRRLQKEKRKLEREKKENLRKHHDHIKILIGAHLLTYFSMGAKDRLLNEADDAEVIRWVDSIMSQIEEPNRERRQ